MEGPEIERRHGGHVFLVRDNSLSYFVTHRATEFQGAIGESTRRLASSKRINDAGDDAAGLAVSDRLKIKFDGLTRAGRNLQDGVSLVQIAEGGIELLSDLLQRVRVYAVQSANGSYQDSDREDAQLFVDQLLDEIDRQVETIRFNDQTLLDGSHNAAAGGVPFTLQAGADAGDTLVLSIRSLSTASLGVDGLRGTGIATQAAAVSALTLLSNAIETVVQERGRLAGAGRRVDEAIRFVGLVALDQKAAEAKIRDLDYADGIEALQRARTLGQASLSAVANVHVIAEGALALLG